MKKEMLINVMQPEECRIAIVEDGVLEELYVERTSQESYVGNIYKGRIVNIEPSIQAVFVDFGIGRNGFLHVSDVEPTYYRHLDERRTHDTPRRGHRDRGRDERDDRGGRGGRGGRGRGGRGERDDRGERGRRSGHSEDQGRQRQRPPSRHQEEEERQRQFAQQEIAAADAGLDTQADFLPRESEEQTRRQGETPGTFADRPPADESAATKQTDSPVSKDDPRREAPERERQRFMDSAERRTEKDAPRTSSISDADIFFPKEDTEPAVPSAVPAALPHAETPRHLATDVPHAVHEQPTRALAVSKFEDRSDQIEEPEELFEESAPADRPMPEPLDEPDAEAPMEMMDDMGDFEDDLPPSYEDEEEEPRRRRPPGDGGRRGRPFRRGPGRPGMGRPKPLIQDIFRRGQEVLVQVIKEGIGTKGPTLSTYISIAGRYLVLMPGLNRVGVSRKIIDEDARRRLRDIFHELQPPKGLGFIIRTAGMDKTKKELYRDLAYLARLWQVVVRRIRKLKAPAEIYQESDMITRTIRDTFTNDIDTVWVDQPAAFEHAEEFLQVVMPRYANRIKLYGDPEPLFYKYGIEDEISRIQRRHVPLPAGGSIVIDQTEALVAIDVNSGNFRADNNAEETAYQMNLQAAKEIARQLRLRDLGGVIVNDFIDMREEKHRRGVERALRDAVKRDRARTKILKISQFGLIEMTRQRIRPSLKRSIYQECPHCRSTGQVKTTESMSIDVMRMIQLAAHRPNIARVQIKVADEVAVYLLNKKRKEIARLEAEGEIHVSITPVEAASPETLEFACFDNNNNEIKFLTFEESKPRRR
jgi:ribonuclease E